jgi:RNA-splicing ligase RtcB
MGEVKIYDASGREIEWEQPKPYIPPVESPESKKRIEAIAEASRFHKAERKWELEQFGIIQFGVNGIHETE